MIFFLSIINYFQQCYLSTDTGAWLFINFVYTIINGLLVYFCIVHEVVLAMWVHGAMNKFRNV